MVLFGNRTTHAKTKRRPATNLMQRVRRRLRFRLLAEVRTCPGKAFKSWAVAQVSITVRPTRCGPMASSGTSWGWRWNTPNTVHVLLFQKKYDNWNLLEHNVDEWKAMASEWGQEIKLFTGTRRMLIHKITKVSVHQNPHKRNADANNANSKLPLKKMT